MADGIVPTRNAAAKALGIAPRVLSMWTHEDWFPADAVGKDAKGNNRDWNIPAIKAARDANDKKGVAESTQSAKLTSALKAQKLRRERVRADREEREEAERRGNVLKRDELLSTHRELITQTRTRLMHEIPREIAKRFPKQQKRIFEICEAQVRKILTDLSRDLAEVVLDLPDQS